MMRAGRRLLAWVKARERRLRYGLSEFLFSNIPLALAGFMALAGSALAGRGARIATLQIGPAAQKGRRSRNCLPARLIWQTPGAPRRRWLIGARGRAWIRQRPTTPDRAAACWTSTHSKPANGTSAH